MRVFKPPQIDTAISPLRPAHDRRHDNPPVEGVDPAQKRAAAPAGGGTASRPGRPGRDRSKQLVAIRWNGWSRSPVCAPQGPGRIIVPTEGATLVTGTGV